MLYVLRLAAVLKATDLVMDSEFIILEDGNYSDKPADSIKTVKFLNIIEVLKDGFENDRYVIKLVPVRFNSTDIFYPLVDADKKQRYTDKAKPLVETLENFGKKLGVEVRDPSELSEFQRSIIKEV